MKDDFEVVWHGGMVDRLGTKGGLLGEYRSRSTWHQAARVLAAKIGPPVTDEDNDRAAEAKGLTPESDLRAILEGL